MYPLSAWIKAVRAPFFTATIVPVILGTAIAWSETNDVNYRLFGLALVGALLIHAGTNLVNDYYDHKSGNDWENKTPTVFSGGSRVIQDGLLKPQQIIRGAIFCYAASSAIGLYLSLIIGGSFLLLLGIFGVCVGVLYTASPVALSYRGHGFGELAVGLGFGPLMVVGANYVQTQQYSATAFFASVPIAVLITLVLLINEFPDYTADAKVGKLTLTVVLGKKNAAKLYLLLIFIVYFYTLALAVLAVLPKLSLITLLTMPLAFKAIRTIQSKVENIYELIPANAATVVLHLVFGALLILSFVL